MIDGMTRGLHDSCMARIGSYSRGRDESRYVLHWLWMLAAVCCLSAQTPAAVLTHRYSFDGDTTDSVGGADGILEGNASIQNGAVVLDGQGSFVKLPNDLFTNYSSATYELWFVDRGVNSIGALLYSFAGPKGGINYYLTGQGATYLNSNGVTNRITLEVPVIGGTNHLVFIQDSSSGASIYANGKLLSSGSPIFGPINIGSTTNDCIGGGGGISTASYFTGRILEFRTYQGDLSSLDVAVSDALGPDQVLSDPGALQDIRLAGPSVVEPGALVPAQIFADYANVSNVDLSQQGNVKYYSDNTNIIAVPVGTNVLQSLLTNGTANITAVWNGLSNTLAITVAVPQDVTLLHRYSFSEQAADWVVHDSIGTANGRLYGSAGQVGFSGAGELAMTGYPATGSYAALPRHLISALGEVSFEAWVTWSPGNVALGYGSGGWQRIFDIGTTSGTQGSRYIFLTPATDNVSFTTKSVLHTAITLSDNGHETPRLNWTNYLPTNVLSHVAVTYSPAKGVMKMYLNGVPVASGTATIPLSGILDTHCWLGRSLFSVDPYYNGSFDEFRIYQGLLSDADVAADYAAGPDAVGVDYILRSYPGTNGITITWGPSAGALTLETSPAIGTAANWTPVSSSQTSFQNGRYTTTVPIMEDAPAAYFRLHAK